MTAPLPFLIREAAEAYHALRGEFLSSHALADFRRCPYLFQQKRLGLIKDEPRPAYLLGQAAHTLILEGRAAYETAYAFGGPVNPKTGEPFGPRTKAWAEWSEAVGKPVLTDDQVILIAEMDASVRRHEVATALLSAGVPEGVLRAEYGGLQCQARLDWLNPERGIVDLKTCDSLDYFEADARRYGYAYQLAFYHALLERVTGVPASVYLVAVEKAPPFRCGVWRVGEEVIALASAENEAAMSRLRTCQEADRWPTCYEGLRTFDCL